jgi:hypothetical protein
VFTKDPRELVMMRGTREEVIPQGFEHFAES